MSSVNAHADAGALSSLSGLKVRAPSLSPTPWRRGPTEPELVSSSGQGAESSRDLRSTTARRVPACVH